MANVALIAGVTGLVGNNLATQLLSNGWEVLGLARNPESAPAGVVPVSGDLLDPASLTKALENHKPTHLFFASWRRQPDEPQNIAVNGAMLRNFLEAAAAKGTVQHAALVTGLKHYLGPFEMYAKGTPLDTPFRESQPRLAVENFYYSQEDILFELADKYGFGWSVHRPHTAIGAAIGAAMNIGVTLAIYASICRETGRPFVFPGSASQWNGITDMTDARQLAKHMEWASITPAARNQAMNIVNGDTFRWKWMWSRIAEYFDLTPAPFVETGIPMEKQMANDAEIWSEMAKRYNLREPSFDRLASPWHTDADLGRPFECITDMSKTRELGFTGYQATDKAFYELFDRLRADKIIPGAGDRP